MAKEDELMSSPVLDEKITDDQLKSADIYDAEQHRGADLPELKRKLKSRHLQMIAIVVVSLRQMATFIPISAPFTSYGTRFVDPSLGFAMGMGYIGFSWAITCALQLTATRPNHPVQGSLKATWPSYIDIISGLSIIGYQFVWHSLFGICMNAGVGKQGYLGFTYWKDPGAFAPYLLDVIGEDRVALGKFIGFWAVLIQAGFSYQGTELVGVAVGETMNPRKSVPAAIKKTFYRILFLFVLTVFFIGILIPYTNKDLLSDASDASASPFVIAVKLAGVKTLPGLINGVLLTVVLSAANSNVYSGSRIVVGLAQVGCAPRFFMRTTAKGVPIPSVLFTSAFGLLGFLNLSNNGSVVFQWFTNISSIAGFISWSCINGCHIRFMRALRARNINRDELPYKAPLEPYLAYYGLFFNVLIIITQGFTAFIPWSTTNFFIAYISLILFVVLFIGHKAVFRTRLVKLWEVDLDTGRLESDLEPWDSKEPLTFKQKVRHRLASMFC
ncbi:hypothetical protein UREG_05180 [Uncinocarpus reesii 1704]|uniref:Amino acid permease/ SLC12A domain-containing protein n=1 Tax=Uncinocarpus reesii (strain UAMH 1704) TaxID=336963 RepID=C4JRU1_UNCRE|nr:uncharacterized protein UREG_05180 [Uncinocarpus reesii 1704]EEP80338.1 hypothetical protein UREG_05180 [Uncinocarpus reesii 1704]